MACQPEATSLRLVNMQEIQRHAQSRAAAASSGGTRRCNRARSGLSGNGIRFVSQYGYSGSGYSSAL